MRELLPAKEGFRHGCVMAVHCFMCKGVTVWKVNASVLGLGL